MKNYDCILPENPLGFYPALPNFASSRTGGFQKVILLRCLRDPPSVPATGYASKWSLVGPILSRCQGPDLAPTLRAFGAYRDAGKDRADEGLPRPFRGRPGFQTRRPRERGRSAMRVNCTKDLLKNSEKTERKSDTI